MLDENEEARIIHELVRADNGSDPFSAAVRGTRMPMVIADPRLDDCPIVFANDSFSRLTGFAREEIIGRNCRFLQGPDTDRAAVAKVRAALNERRLVELDLLNYRKDGTTFWNRLLISPVFGGGGELTYFFASQYDVTLERERLVRLQRDRDELEAEVGARTSDLRESEARLRFALKAGRLGSWTLDLSSGRMIVSEGCKANFGRPLDQPFTYEDLLAAAHPADRERRDAAVEAAVENGTDLDIEYRVLTPDGGERWVEIRGQAAYRADGTPLSLGGTSQDVTERKRAEEHRALLAGELSHRVKNMLATLQAVVVQTLRRAGSLEEAGETLEARIQAMANANDLLVNQRWEGATIRDLAHRALAPFGADDGGKFLMDGPDARVPPRVAVSLALGLHELATNAAKYGALSTAGGRVALTWKVDGGSSARRLHLRWEETGGPAVKKPDRAGFGSRLIERVMARELRGEAEIRYLPSGVVFETVAPLPDAAEEAAVTP